MKRSFSISRYRNLRCCVVSILLITSIGKGAVLPMAQKIAQSMTTGWNPVTKKTFNFIAGVDGNFKEALKAASDAAASGKRFYLFFPDGEYDIGTLTGNDNQMSTVTTSNISFIGQSTDNTVIFNKSIQEGISITATLCFNNADNLYLQDITILNKAAYGNPSTYSTTSRHVAVMEQGDDIIYKNVRLLSTQDTYYTKGTRTYWENGEIHGTTDFICGNGDIFFHECLLYINKDSYITAPATSTPWGYVFMNCIIDGTVDSYKLGRSWNGSPKCVYINTTMKKQPTAIGWGDPMNVVPSRFAEYNSKTASGSAVNLAGRRTTYSAKGTTVTLQPVLTSEQAAQYTIENVMGSLRPDLLTRQLGAPVVRLEGAVLEWDDNDSALCWMVFKNEKFYRCITDNTCEIPDEEPEAAYTVRAANAMGGLGPASEAVYGTVTALSAIRKRSDRDFFIRHDNVGKRLYIEHMSEVDLKIDIVDLKGKKVLSGKYNAGSGVIIVNTYGIKSGMYLLKTDTGGFCAISQLQIW